MIASMAQEFMPVYARGYPVRPLHLACRQWAMRALQFQTFRNKPTCMAASMLAGFSGPNRCSVLASTCAVLATSGYAFLQQGQDASSQTVCLQYAAAVCSISH